MRHVARWLCAIVSGLRLLLVWQLRQCRRDAPGLAVANDEVSGAIMPMVRANSRASFTGAPLTAVMTSPDSIPAFAAGLPLCGSSTIAPAAFFKQRLSAMSAVTG